MLGRVFAGVLIAVLLGSVAQAQAPTQRIRGTIVSLDGQVLTVATREGPQVKVTLADKFGVGAVKKIDLSAITPGTFIGTATSPEVGGKLVALEVLLLPESARGAGEGHYAWDLAPGSMMTNATVDAEVQGSSGRELTLKYKGGSVVVTVPPGVPIVTPTTADVSDVKPGAAVLIFAAKAADGSLSAARITVAKDGVAPPM